MNADGHFDTRRLNAVPITEVARRLGMDLRRAGTVSRTLCPWHDDRHPSLVLYERTDENRCHCFSCGKGGSAIDLVMQREGIPFREACEWLSRTFGIPSTTSPGSGRRASTGYRRRPAARPVTAGAETDYTYIPLPMVEQMMSAGSSLCRCLARMYQPEAVEWLVGEYRLGCYSMNGHDDYTVFPNIDRQGRVCNVKAQHYDCDPTSARFGHSDKGLCYWLGAIWVREGRLPAGARFRSACLFGEHLLTRYPASTVALVESPKNALFGALTFPQLTWVATGSKTMLTRPVLEPLRGRDIVVIPDADAVDAWAEALDGMDDLANFSVSDFCRRTAPGGNLKFDIADYLQQRRIPP